MQKITIISGTNRPGSYTNKVALDYQLALDRKGFSSELLSLTELPADITFAEVFGKRSAGFQKLVEQYIRPCRNFIFVVPEYNGSFPGILKVFLDAVHPSEWNEKNACLTGVSTGRAGNLRGMEHLTNILHYLKMHVYHNKLPISQVDKLYAQAESLLAHDDTQKAMDKQLSGFLDYVAKH